LRALYTPKECDCRTSFNLLQQKEISVLDLSPPQQFSSSHIIGAFNKGDLEKCKSSRRPLIITTKGGDLESARAFRKKFLSLHPKREIYILKDSTESFQSKYPFLMTSSEAKDGADSKDLNGESVSVASRKSDGSRSERVASSRNIIQNPSPRVVRVSYPAEIIPGVLYHGDRHHALSSKVFSDLGITHVVNVTRMVRCKFRKNSKISYLKIPVGDTPDVDILQYLDQTTSFIIQALAKKDTTARLEGKHPDGTTCTPTSTYESTSASPSTGCRNVVLVHCEWGVSRSTTILVAYFIREFGWSIRQSLKHIRSCRPQASPNSGFLKQLKKFKTSSRLGESERKVSGPIP